MEERVLRPDARVSALLPPRRLASRAGSVLMHVVLMNERTREQVATSVEIAATRKARRRGCSAATASTRLQRWCSRRDCGPYGRHALCHRRRVRRSAGLCGEGGPGSPALAHLARRRSAHRHRNAGRQPSLGAGDARGSAVTDAGVGAGVGRSHETEVNPEHWRQQCLRFFSSPITVAVGGGFVLVRRKRKAQAGGIG